MVFTSSIGCFLRRVLEAFDDVVLPRHCLLTGVPLREASGRLPGIADDALDIQPPAPTPAALMADLARHHDADDLMIGDIHAIWRLGRDSDIGRLVHAIKYHGRASLAVEVGRYVGTILAERGVRADVILPVPIHRSRYRERGYNQAERLAAGLREATGIPVVADALVRSRSTGTQTAFTAAGRRSNLIGSIAVVRPEPIAGRHILLVDDVLTTGSTLNTCALAAVAAGARRCTAAVVAAAVMGTS